MTVLGEVCSTSFRSWGEPPVGRSAKLPALLALESSPHKCDGRLTRHWRVSRLVSPNGAIQMNSVFLGDNNAGIIQDMAFLSHQHPLIINIHDP